MTTTPLPPKLLAGPAAFLSTLAAMGWKELLIMLPYPVEFVASFGQIFLIMLVLWRSFPSAVISMLPNLAPLFFVFVLMGDRMRPDGCSGWSSILLAQVNTV